MLNFFAWYLFTSLLGWVSFPLAFHLFPSLKDRGYSLARALGLLFWGYVFWLFTSLGITENNIAGLLFVLFLLVPIDLYLIFKKKRISEKIPGKISIIAWIKSNRRLIISVELLFFFAFAFLAFVRACNPDAVGTEKPMEMAFINAIMHSPTFPPHDPWLSGYAISYYYFGYVLTAMLAEITGTLGSVAFNLMLALVFALSAVGAYGIIFNLLSAWREKRENKGGRKKNQHFSIYGFPFLGPFFLLLVSNWEGFLEVLHHFGLLWKTNADGVMRSGFWTWLGIQDLTQPPTLPMGNLPDSMRYYWWWRASRVVHDVDLAGRSIEIIDEFPFFSYLLGDLHPHVLSMPFVLLTVAFAINIFLGGVRGKLHFEFYKININITSLLFGGFLIGCLAFLNTWDILTGLALLIGAYVLGRVKESGWSWKRLLDGIFILIPLILLMVLFFLPFYVGFSSQAGGIMPNVEFPTRGVQLWVMFGSLFLPIIAYFVLLPRLEEKNIPWVEGMVIAVGVVIFLWAFSWLLAAGAFIGNPEYLLEYIHNDGLTSVISFFLASSGRRISFIGSLVTLVVLMGFALGYLANSFKRHVVEGKLIVGEKRLSNPSHFILFISLVAFLLILGPDFLFLRDQFGNRMNTIFKFYYQAWILMSIAAAFGVAVILIKIRGFWKWIFRTGLVILFFMALCYPVLGLMTKTDNFKIESFVQNLKVARLSSDLVPIKTAARVWSLDGESYLKNYYPDDMSAADWLRTVTFGVIVEATKRDASYTDYCYISTYSGLPTVLGWPMHEGQWRGTYEPQGSRLEDIQILYETNSWEEANSVISKYNIKYVYIGTLEQRTYRVDDEKFKIHLEMIFQSGPVSVYAVP